MIGLIWGLPPFTCTLIPLQAVGYQPQQGRQLMDRIDLRPYNFPHAREQDEAVPSLTMGAIQVLARLAIYFLSLLLALKSAAA
jgi:hypothetical protein